MEDSIDEEYNMRGTFVVEHKYKIIFSQDVIIDLKRNYIKFGNGEWKPLLKKEPEIHITKSDLERYFDIS